MLNLLNLYLFSFCCLGVLLCLCLYFFSSILDIVFFEVRVKMKEFWTWFNLYDCLEESHLVELSDLQLGQLNLS